MLEVKVKNKVESRVRSRMPFYAHKIKGFFATHLRCQSIQFIYWLDMFRIVKV